MKESHNKEQVVNLLLNSIDFDSYENFQIKEFIRPNESPKIKKKLRLYIEDERRYTSSIDEYLDSINLSEMRFYRQFAEAIPLTDSMNPHVIPYKLKEYFADKVDNKLLNHLKKLNNLCECNKKNELNLKACKGVLQIGEIGSGKTFSQNNWLHDNNVLFEKHKIYWVRLDAAKLIRLWDESDDLKNPNLTTIEEYFIGQLVYVFCKHFIEKYPLRNELFVEIANKLSKSEVNKIPKSKFEFKSQTKISISGFDFFTFYANKNGITTIIDFLYDLERQIAIYEGLNDGEDSRLPVEKRKHTDKSFLIDRVFLESQKFTADKYLGNKNIWMILGNILKDFILSQGYSLLYIIDGIENVNFLFHEKRNYIEKILVNLYNFPLNQFNSHPNEFIYISLRDTTYESLKRIIDENKFTDFNKYINIDSFVKIYQETSGVLPIALSKRMDYIYKDKACDDCYMKEVINQIKEFHCIPDEKRWNSNIRSFLSNHISLAKLITFRYYFADQPPKFNIRNQINSFENINYFLNGELYINEQSKSPAADKGYHLFNLFGYVEKRTNHPSYLIYTRILQLIQKKFDITLQKLLVVTKAFGYADSDVLYCIDNLTFNGLIKSSYTPKVQDKIKFQITNKGEFALDSFFNNIHFLYYASINTLLPNEIIDNIKVSPNNFPKNAIKKRFYPPYCIQTALVFLQYLITWNKYENKIALGRDKNIDPLFLTIPVDINNLSQSISEMVEISLNDTDYRTELISFVDKMVNENNK